MTRRITGALFAAVLAFLLLPRAFPAVAVFVRLHVARPLAAFAGSLSARVSFPLAGYFTILAALIIAALSLLSFRSPRAALLCALLCAYWAMWGSLYACPAARADVLSNQALSRLCRRLIDEADMAMTQAAPEGDLERLLETGCALMRAQTGLPLSPAKAARHPGLLTRLGLAGLYFPFTGESIVNPEDCPDTLPFTICHELAHQAGVAREDEASYCAFLACETSESALFRYSACFTALLYAMKSLRAADRADWLNTLSRMSDALYGRFVRANGLAAALPGGAQQGLTDVFLRLNGDPDGISSYERVLPLLAAHWRIDAGAGQ